MNFLNNIGASELLVILLLALLVVGPERLPEIARKLGALVRDLRKMYEDAGRDLNSDLGSVLETVQQVREQVDSVASIPHEMIRSLSQTAALGSLADDLKATWGDTTLVGQTASLAVPSGKDLVPAAIAATAIADPTVSPPPEETIKAEKQELENQGLATQERPATENHTTREILLNE
jgi:sec-independent protein translocase protein TatB